MPVSKEKFIQQVTARMRKLVDSCDPEVAHSDADDLLVTALAVDDDYAEFLELYEQVPKWYA